MCAFVVSGEQHVSLSDRKWFVISRESVSVSSVSDCETGRKHLSIATTSQQEPLTAGLALIRICVAVVKTFYGAK